MKDTKDYVIRLLHALDAEQAAQWNRLLAEQAHPTPFMHHEYLEALEQSGSATPETGWQRLYLWAEQGGALVGACVLYLKSHSYGEYVFDWAWAQAYEEHGLQYYPKGLVAVPFTPVPGARLLARSAGARLALLQAMQQIAAQSDWSSLHLLFLQDDDLQACRDAGWSIRDGVQFHWRNGGETGPAWADFDAFLAALSQEKRKKIRQERRKVHDAGVVFRQLRGHEISEADWNFFYRCYAQTYREHGNPPYLTRDFFRHLASSYPQMWLLFIASVDGQDVAASLVALSDEVAALPRSDGVPAGSVYGRYWGALARIDSLHFEACYYQPLQWCLAHRVAFFEGGAQGEHKMARALLPIATHSAHWLRHAGFAAAVNDFLARETRYLDQYQQELAARSPLKKPPSAAIRLGLADAPASSDRAPEPAPHSDDES